MGEWLVMARGKDLTGQRFGRLTVLGLNEEESSKLRPSGKRMIKIKYYDCQCDCGTIKTIRGNCLSNGSTTSCGCYNRELNSERSRANLVGQRFGRLTVVAFSHVEKQSTYWLCQCDCGGTKVVHVRELNGGHTQSCGCLRRETVVKKNIDNTKGTTQISRHLRSLGVVEEWKDNARKQVNYTCQLTGKYGGRIPVHHLYAFSSIVEDAHTTNNIKIKEQVQDYTKEELELLEQYVVEWHKDTTNAVVLCEEVHNLFHRSKENGGYGIHNNTPQQYEEFKQRYLNGEFNTEEEHKDSDNNQVA